MKKVLSTMAILATATAVFAQGYLNFNAAGIPIVQTNTAVSTLFGGLGSGGVTGNTFGSATATYYYALLISPYTGTITSDKAVWDGSWAVGQGVSGPITTVNLAGAGRVSAATGAGANPFQTSSAGAGWAAGTYYNIVLVGWSANLGSTWSVVSGELSAIALGGTAAPNEFFGESDLGYLTPNVASPGAAIFGAAADANGLPIDNGSANPMYLYALPVPEPGTMALAGLGGLALMLIRRRK
jgi:hypothetical protein